jgi:hypothetical protein
MQMRELALAAIILALAGSHHALAKNKPHGHSHGHSRHSVAKLANQADAPSATSASEVSDQRHPDDLALDRKIKSICRGC